VRGRERGEGGFLGPDHVSAVSCFLDIFYSYIYICVCVCVRARARVYYSPFL